MCNNWLHTIYYTDQDPLLVEQLHLSPPYDDVMTVLDVVDC